MAHGLSTDKWGVGKWRAMRNEEANTFCVQLGAA